MPKWERLPDVEGYTQGRWIYGPIIIEKDLHAGLSPWTICLDGPDSAVAWVRTKNMAQTFVEGLYAAIAEETRPA